MIRVPPSGLLYHFRVPEALADWEQVSNQSKTSISVTQNEDMGTLNHVDNLESRRNGAIFVSVHF